MLRAPWVMMIGSILYSLLYFLSLALRGEGLRSLIKFISGKVNDIYMAQWVMILWTRYIILRNVDITPWLFWALSAAITCLSVAYAWVRTQAKQARAQKAAPPQSPTALKSIHTHTKTGLGFHA